MSLLLGVEVAKGSDAIMLVVGDTELQWQFRGGGSIGQEGLQISLLLLKTFQCTGCFLQEANIDVDRYVDIKDKVICKTVL